MIGCLNLTEVIEISVKRHLELIREVVKELSITHEDVCMRLLAMSFQGTIECWFLNLMAYNIFGYNMFEHKFLEEWGNESDDMELLNQTSPPSDPMAEIFTDINFGEDPFHPIFIDEVKLSSNTDEDETYNQLVEDSFNHSPQMDRFSFEVFPQEK